MRTITTETRKRLELIIKRLGTGEEVSLSQRIELTKYSRYIPFIAGKLSQALRQRESVGNDELI